MNSKKELILKYKRRIQQMEKAIDLHNGDAPRLIAKCSILRLSCCFTYRYIIAISVLFSYIFLNMEKAIY